MAPFPDYSSILHSPSFTFLVGPEHTKLTVQSGIAKHVSQPLDELMNNGQTRESRHHIAVLEEEDVETFIGFCEFAYSGDYTVPSRQAGESKTSKQDHTIEIATPQFGGGIPPPAPTPPVHPGMGHPPEFVEKPAGDDDFAGGNQSFAVMEDERNKDRVPKKKGKKDKKEKGKKESSKSMNDGTGTLTPPTTPPLAAEEQAADATQEGSNEDTTMENVDDSTGPTDWFDSVPPKATNMELSKQATDNELPQTQHHGLVPPPRPDGRSLWDDFVSIQYTRHEQHSVASLPSPIRESVSGYSESNVPYLCFHAKIYTFATHYLIPTLAQLALAKLHRDLVKFPLASTDNAGGDPNALVVLELLQYTYMNTKRSDPVSSYGGGHENQLRKLIVHYAACKVRELAPYYPMATKHQSWSVGTRKNGPPVTGLRGLLDSLGELASDLVYRMM